MEELSATGSLWRTTHRHHSPPSPCSPEKQRVQGEDWLSLFVHLMLLLPVPLAAEEPLQ